MDLAALFSFSTSPWEIVLRGSAVYWFLFLLFRFVLRRDVGAIAITDVLLVVLIADASQNAMAGTADSLADGFLLVATLAAWNYALDWVSFYSPALRRLLDPGAVLLVRDGKPLRKNLRRELITMDELMSELRKQGLESLDQVKAARMEGDGDISIVPHDGVRSAPPGDHQPPGA